VFSIEKLKDQWKIVDYWKNKNIKNKILNLNKKTLFSIFPFFFFKKLEYISPILNNPLMFNISRREASGVVLCINLMIYCLN